MPRPIDIAYRIRRWLLRVLRWPTRGVKVMAFNARGEMLLIRNRYGRRDLFVLPGGGIGRGEAPAAAAIREVREETGCRLRDVVPVGRYRSVAEGKRDTVHVFRATTDDPPLADGIEVAVACFVAIDALPETISPATRRRIDELCGRRSIDGMW